MDIVMWLTVVLTDGHCVVADCGVDRQSLCCD